MDKSATVTWKYGFKEGTGSISTESGALDQVPFSRETRFEQVSGTNPEELVAAALASCFSMALAADLEKLGAPPEEIQTECFTTLEKTDAGWTVTRIHLEVMGDVPGMEQFHFEQVAQEVKANCPIARLLNAKITLTARLETEERFSQAV